MCALAFEHGVSIAQFAAIQAGISKGFSLSALLHREQLGSADWRSASKAWHEHLAHGNGRALASYQRLFVLASTLLQPRLLPYDTDLFAWILLSEASSASSDPLLDLPLPAPAWARLQSKWVQATQRTSTAALAAQLRRRLQQHPLSSYPQPPDPIFQPTTTEPKLGFSWNQQASLDASDLGWQVILFSQALEMHCAFQAQCIVHPTKRSALLHSLQLNERQVANIQACWQQRFAQHPQLQRHSQQLLAWFKQRNEFLRDSDRSPVSQNVAIGFGAPQGQRGAVAPQQLSIDGLALRLLTSQDLLQHDTDPALPTSHPGDQALSSQPPYSSAPPTLSQHQDDAAKAIGNQASKTTQPHRSTTPAHSTHASSSDWHGTNSTVPPSSGSNLALPAHSTLPAGTTMPPTTTIPPFSTHPAPVSMGPNDLAHSSLPPILHEGHSHGDMEPYAIEFPYPLANSLTLRPTKPVEASAASDPTAIDLEQYAAICAELSLKPTNRDDVMRRYSIASTQHWRALQTHFKEQLQSQASEQARFDDLLKIYTLYLKQKQGTSTPNSPTEPQMERRTKHSQKVETIFDSWADNGRAEGMQEGHSVAAKQAFEHLELRAGQRYLDVGCGNGYTVRWAAAVDPTVQAYGVDLSPNMVARARKQSKDYKNARFIHGPYPIRELRARSFDAILSMEVFYYFENLEWALISTLRLLKPAGLFACVVDFYEENTASHGWPGDLGVQMKLLSADGWQQAMTDVGFEVLEQRRIKATDSQATNASWKQTEGSLLTLARAPWPSENASEPAE